MKNVMKRTSIIISLFLIIVLAFTLSITFKTQEIDKVSADVNVSQSSSIDGKMLDDDNILPIDANTAGIYYSLGLDGNYHLNNTGVNFKYSDSTPTKITTANELVNFINNANNNTKKDEVGVLMNDIEYDMSTSGLNITSSNTAFFGILDGNGYKINIKPHEGNSNLSFNSNYRGDRNDQGNTEGIPSKSAPFKWYAFPHDYYYNGYYYAGLLCAVNEGTIKNVNVVLKNGSLGDQPNNVGSATLNMPGEAGDYQFWTGIVGIYCGLLYNGEIFNCSLSINTPFAIAKADSGISEVVGDTIAVGGFCGNIESNAILERSTLYLNSSLTALASGGKDNGGGAAFAGGLAGIIRPDDSSAKIINCSLYGTGAVRGLLTMGENDLRVKQARGLAGGAVATSSYFTDKDNLSSGSVANGSIKGILSGWTGVRHSIWGNRGDGGRAVIEKTIAGSLFDDIGSEPLNIVILFDYIDCVKNGSNALGKDYTTLDSGQTLTYGSWTEVYSSNNDGVVSVNYDYSKEDTPIRIEAVANNFFSLGNYNGDGSINMKLGENETQQKFLLKDTQDNLGYFIWSCNYSNTTYGEVSGSHIDTAEDLVGAEIYYISQNLLGAVIYTFGESATLNYINTNEQRNIETAISEYSKYYDGININNPTFEILRKNGQNVTINSDAYDMKKTYTILNGDIPTDYSYSIPIENNTLNYLPGLYSFIPEHTTKYISSSDKDFAYYDEASCVLVNTSIVNPYEYVIYPGNNSLFNATCNTSSTNWGLTDEVTLSYNNRANAISYYTYSVGTGAQSAKIEMPENEIYDTLTIGSSNEYRIHENGKIRLNLKAYILNPLAISELEEEKYIAIGNTSVISYVDNEAPVYKNVKYYEYDSDAENHMGFELLEEELEDWVSTNVWVVYTISDNYLSGLASGNGDDESYRISSSDKYECKVLLTGERPTVETVYQDNVGNIASRTFSANIDSTVVRLEDVVALNSQEYLVYYANYGYCPVEVVLTFTPIFGIGGAYLQYSYEKDKDGNDIWITYNENLQANTPNTFVMNFLMIEKNFKMKLVSATGLYADAYANGDGFVTNGASNAEEAKVWTIKATIAYIGITLDNLIYNGSSLSTQNLNELFAKNYDGTTDSSLNISVDLYQSGNVVKDNTYIVYTDKYKYSAPLIQVDYLKVNIIYDSAVSGNRIVSIRVDSIDEYQDKYEVYFSNQLLEEILDFADEEKADKIYEGINTSITPVSLNINLADYNDQLKSTYVYGSVIPTSIFVQGLNEELMELILDTEAKLTYQGNKIVGYPDVGSYRVNAHMAIEDENIQLLITKVDIQVTPKYVIVETALDGNIDYSTSVSFDGVQHKITGTYIDVFNEEKPATIVYYSNAACTNLVSNEYAKAVGIYYAKLSIDSSNYEVSNTGSCVQFSIVKGYISIDLAEQIKSYTGKNVKFDIKPTTATSTEYYSDDDFVITYYPHINGLDDLSQPLSTISAVGKYLVQVEIKGNAYFFDYEFDDTYITINKADVKASIMENIEIPYDGNNHTISLEKCGFGVKDTATDKIIIGRYIDNDIAKIVYYDGNNRVDIEQTNLIDIYYYNVNKYVKVDEINTGLFSNVGTYTFRINFVGTECYKESFVYVDLIIKAKKIEGIAFDSPTYNYVEGVEYSIELEDEEPGSEVLSSYINMGAKISYIYNDEIRVQYENGELNPEFVQFAFSQTGTYTISAQIELENYTTFNIFSMLTIDKSAMKNIVPIGVTITYDGKVHYAEFSGFDKDSSNKQIIQKVDNSTFNVFYNGVQVTATFDNKAYATNAGNYYGKIKFVSEEYADLTIETNITIEPVQLSNSAFDFSELQSQIEYIDSNYDLRQIGATFTGVDGKQVNCSFKYYDELDQNEVFLDSKGHLEPGKYIIRIKFNNGNYTSNVKVEITIAEGEESGEDNPSNPSGGGSSSSLFDKDKLLIIVPVAGAVTVAILGITIGVVLKKKKGTGKRKKKEDKKPKKNKDNKTKIVDKDEATF